MDLSNSRTERITDSPMGSVYDLRNDYSGRHALLDLTQGAPCYGPPEAILDHLTVAMRSTSSFGYPARPGLPRLRELFARDLSEMHLSHISKENVLITAGCNQAFCIAISSIANQNSAVLLEEPFYFNHDMWLRLEGMIPQYFSIVDGDWSAARNRITADTRAMVVVTPGNPTGLIYSSDTLDEIAEFTKDAGITLIVDETYRMFRESTDPPHRLYDHRDWASHIVFLYSFSKEFAIPGLRVGALVGSQSLVRAAQKLMECLTVCASSIGQEAVIAGLEHCTEWRRRAAHEVNQKGRLFKEQFINSPGGFDLLSSGGFFGWVKHPFANTSSESVVRHIMSEAGLLTLPGTLFTNQDSGCLRMSFANISLPCLSEIGRRLTELNPTWGAK